MDNSEPETRSLKAIGERLKLLRAIKDLTQKEFAESAGLHPQLYSQYERGKKRPSIESAFALHEVYGITLDWIYLGDQSGLPVRLVQAFSSYEQEDNSNYG